jgi:hypothetical protein
MGCENAKGCRLVEIIVPKRELVEVLNCHDLQNVGQ